MYMITFNNCPHCGKPLPMTEVWKPVVQFESWYEVSNVGRVKRIGKGRGSSPGRVLIACPNTGGYPTVWLSLPSPSQRFARMVHLLVAEAFIGPPCGREVNHKDGDKSNNSLTNLEYTSRLGNSRHASVHGLYQRGSDRHNSRLTESAVREIKRLYKETQYQQKDIAEIYSVSRGTIQAILSGKTWGWLA